MESIETLLEPMGYESKHLINAMTYAIGIKEGEKSAKEFYLKNKKKYVCPNCSTPCRSKDCKFRKNNFPFYITKAKKIVINFVSSSDSRSMKLKREINYLGNEKFQFTRL